MRYRKHKIGTKTMISIIYFFVHLADLDLRLKSYVSTRYIPFFKLTLLIVWKRWQQHKSATRLWNKNYKPFSAHRNRRQMKKSCGRLGFFQVVSVNSSPMLHYTEQVAINTKPFK